MAFARRQPAPTTPASDPPPLNPPNRRWGGGQAFQPQAPAQQEPQQPPTQSKWGGGSRAGGGGSGSRFAGVRQAQVTRRNDNINEGDYVLRVVSVVYQEGRSKNFVIVEADVVVSSYDEADTATHGCNREGDRLSLFIIKNDAFLANMKELVIALSGCDEQGNPRPEDDEVSEEECEAIISDANPANGALVYVEARQITTRAGNPFTRVSWWACPAKPDGSPDLDRLQR